MTDKPGGATSSHRSDFSNRRGGERAPPARLASAREIGSGITEVAIPRPSSPRATMRPTTALRGPAAGLPSFLTVELPPRSSSRASSTTIPMQLGRPARKRPEARSGADRHRVLPRRPCRCGRAQAHRGPDRPREPVLLRARARSRAPARECALVGDRPAKERDRRPEPLRRRDRRADRDDRRSSCSRRRRCTAGRRGSAGSSTWPGSSSSSASLPGRQGSDFRSAAWRRATSCPERSSPCSACPMREANRLLAAPNPLAQLVHVDLRRPRDRDERSSSGS